MTKLVTALGGAGVAALGVVLAVAIAGTGGSPASTTLGATTTDSTTTAETTTTATTSTGVDVSGPCDEAEHRNDPRCTGAFPQNTVSRAEDDDDRAGDDHGRGRGRGRGGDDRHDDDHHHEDRSGSDSGRG